MFAENVEICEPLRKVRPQSFPPKAFPGEGKGVTIKVDRSKSQGKAVRYIKVFSTSAHEIDSLELKIDSEPVALIDPPILLEKNNVSTVFTVTMMSSGCRIASVTNPGKPELVPQVTQLNSRKYLIQLGSKESSQANPETNWADTKAVSSGKKDHILMEIKIENAAGESKILEIPIAGGS